MQELLPDQRLRQAIRLLPRLGGGRLRRPALRLVTGYAQLAGWVSADAGAGPASRRAYRVALRAAAVAGDRELAAHVLGSLSALSLASGAGQEALLLARPAWRGCGVRLPAAGGAGPAASGGPAAGAAPARRRPAWRRAVRKLARPLPRGPG